MSTILTRHLGALHRLGRRHTCTEAVIYDRVDDLAQLLREAKDAHSEWEAQHGPDPDWPTWYAEYILGRR